MGHDKGRANDLRQTTDICRPERRVGSIRWASQGGRNGNRGETGDRDGRRGTCDGGRSEVQAAHFYWISCPYFCGLTVTVLRVQFRLRGRATGTPEPSRAVGCEWWRVRSHPNSRIVALARDVLRERMRAPKLLQRVAKLSVDRCRIARLRRHWHPPLHLRADKAASMIAASSNRRRRPSTARGDYI